MKCAIAPPPTGGGGGAGRFPPGGIGLGPFAIGGGGGPLGGFPTGVLDGGPWDGGRGGGGTWGGGGKGLGGTPGAAVTLAGGVSWPLFASGGLVLKYNCNCRFKPEGKLAKNQKQELIGNRIRTVIKTEQRFTQKYHYLHDEKMITYQEKWLN